VEFERYEDGVPSWVDLGSTDLEKSREFYAALFGWNCPAGPPEAGGYSVCDLGGKTVAGLGPLMNPGMPPVWMTYVNVDSADATAAKVAANGGTVFAGPMDVMDAGRMVVFADPIGAVIGLWQPDQHTGAQVANEPNTYCWSELVTTDLDASKAFYGAVFGWDAVDQGPPGGPPAYTEWQLNGKSIGGMLQKSPDMPAEMPPAWGVYFAVCSWARPTSNRGGLPSSPTTSAPSSTSSSSRDNRSGPWSADAWDGPATRAAWRCWAVPPAGPPPWTRRGSGCSWPSTTE
jgi:predicted enzyme related to lactoylglutathione lyase